MRPAAFLFDMDGLLLDTERMFMRSFLELTGELGVDAAEAEVFFLSLVGTSQAVTSARLARFLPDSVDPAEFEMNWRDTHACNVAQGVPLRPTARQALELLSEQGVPMALVTSTAGHHARHHLKAAGIFDHFAVIKGGDEVSANKPDPAPYREAAEALGVAPTDCAAFEDSDLGIASAVAAGCMAFQIPDLRMPHTPLPDLGQKTADVLLDAVLDSMNVVIEQA
ncbi:MAG: HAD family hydrolase [Cognatishimia sp.]|uniref:HAD family hydrolase n=1 Tax=Cognatishimia sp. TaxID=2211648 RepID=UPI004057D768